jgi:hypothetical protein
VLGGREHRHVDADLGDDHLGTAPLNAGDRAEQLNGLLERGDLLRDRLGEAGDLLVEEVDVGQDRPDPDGVQVIEAALQRFSERGELGAQLALAWRILERLKPRQIELLVLGRAGPRI